MNLANWTPTEIITAWTSTIAVVSLVNKFVVMPAAPTVGRWVSAIISIPSGHLANLLEDLAVIFADVTGGGPPAGSPPNHPDASPPNHPKDGGSNLQRRGFMPTLFGLLIAPVVAVLFGACTPAQVAQQTQIEQTVLNDLKAGKSFPAIEADVCAIVDPSSPQTCTVGAVIVNDAVTLLIDLGVIPANLIPSAVALKLESTLAIAKQLGQ